MSFLLSKVKNMALRSKRISGYMNPKPTVSVIRLEGKIMSGGSPKFGGEKKINLETTRKMIDDAFKQKNLKLVCLNVNSPGGSPVQSDLVSQYIKDKSLKHKVDVIVFVEDMAASGGYWIACAGSKIYACRSSLVGSIGVITASIGVHELIKKYGIESRVFTAGENKAGMNPLEPLKEADIQRLKSILTHLHQHFIDHVKTNRGERLKGDDETLFTGEAWTGNKALELGLVDGIDTVDGYIERTYGDKVKVYRAKRGGGLANLLGAFFDPDFSVMGQLVAVNQLIAANQQLAANEYSGSSFSLDQNSPITTPLAEDSMALKISQESLKLK